MTNLVFIAICAGLIGILCMGVRIGLHAAGDAASWSHQVLCVGGYLGAMIYVAAALGLLWGQFFELGF